MVDSEKIKKDYIVLLDLVKNELEENSAILEYFYYLNDYKQNFINSSNVSFKEDLKEFLRGANRYSDEFVFSDRNFQQIKSTINSIYETLNNIDAKR